MVDNIVENNNINNNYSQYLPKLNKISYIYLPDFSVTSNDQTNN